MRRDTLTNDQGRRAYRMVARAEQQERTRRRILDATKEAVKHKAYPAIRVADVASDAGVTTQTVHLHFGSKEALFLAAVAELGQEVLAARGTPRAGDVPSVVSALIRQNETYGDANWRLLPLEAEMPTIAEALAMGRAGHRAWLEAVFAPVLPHHASARRAALDSLYVATDVGTWKLLRRDLGLSRDRTAAAIEVLIRGALAPPG